jgi:beta-mannosidase
MLCLPLLSPAEEGATQTVDQRTGWQVFQDVHGEGERMGVYRRASRDFDLPAAISYWQPLPRLTHLQLLFAAQPYFGRELRYFNQDPWWYRLEFATSAGARNATLRFEGVDYYAKVWLNGTLPGGHEGYPDPFEFEVGKLLESGRANVPA